MSSFQAIPSYLVPNMSIEARAQSAALRSVAGGSAGARALTKSGEAAGFGHGRR